MATFLDECLFLECYVKSQDVLFKSINLWTTIRGYVFITQRSIQEKSFFMVVYVYDRYHLLNQLKE